MPRAPPLAAASREGASHELEQVHRLTHTELPAAGYSLGDARVKKRNGLPVRATATAAAPKRLSQTDSGDIAENRLKR